MNNFHRGSALLIVLGMLSFMVVSAVGFSIYMRQSRAPSSYLTRNLTARYLVKAALANAIEDLDSGFMSQYDIGIANNNNPDVGYLYGIYDDPYPGVGVQSNEPVNQQNNQQTGTQMSFTKNGNYWFKRVFCPFGTLGYPQNVNKAVEEPVETVPTLTLEALAYLPPAIIDDVRKLSRQTRTAQWKSLPYESGRYAFTAVNVSDLFDVNRLRASVPRNSGRDRITLATLTTDQPDADLTLFDNARLTRAENLDDLIEQALENHKIGGNVVPFTSLADFNLAAIGKNYAPLMKYIGTSAAQIPQSAEAANGMFVTDTWFPSTNGMGSTSFELGGVKGAGQPYLDFTADSLLTACNNTVNDPHDVWKKNLSIGMGCLYDYLDSDSIPISLAFPTTEAVPMVVGISGPLALRPMIPAPQETKKEVEVTQGNHTYKVTRTIKRYMLTDFSGANNLIVNAAVMFPFKRMNKSQRKTSFKVRGLVRVFLADQGLTEGNFKCRTEHLHPDKALFSQANATYESGVATFASAAKTVTFNNDIVDQASKNWIQDVQLLFPASVNVPILQEVSEQWVATNLNPDDPAPPVTKQPVTTLMGVMYGFQGDKKHLFRPYLKNDMSRIMDNDWTTLNVKELTDDISDPKLLPIENLTPFTQAGQYRLCAAVWIQVLDMNDKVVDMVPACFNQDEEWCEPNGGSYSGKGPFNGKAISVDEAVLPFMSDLQNVEFTKDIGTKFAKGAEYPEWDCLLAVDPRFNHAPEDWFCMSVGGGQSSSPKTQWCTAMGVDGGGKVFGQSGRDRDVFMFVSDQEYLQSIGELQFLPYLNDFDGNGAWNAPQFSTAFSCDGRSFMDRKLTGTQLDLDAMKAKFADGDYFWQTYSAYRKETGDSDQAFRYYNPYSLPVCNDAGAFRLNPYSDDERVMAAALVGTPYDYYVASTNENQKFAPNKLITTLKLTDKDYFFGEQSAVAKISKDDLMGGDKPGIADAIIDGFNAAAKGSGWLKEWDKLDWQDPDDLAQIGDNNKKFLDVNMANPLHGVDRKYLYSYWRDCFDNSQQLFLIFVRAEPSTVGGGAAGRVSAAQLGGRAVALVWRDPNVPSGTTGGTRTPRQSVMSRETYREMKSKCPPHRTRVLFYHQFD